jgi:hypothetical protein
MLLQEFAERRELHDLRCNHTGNNARATPRVKREGHERLIAGQLVESRLMMPVATAPSSRDGAAARAADLRPARRPDGRRRTPRRRQPARRGRVSPSMSEAIHAQ